MAKLPWAPVVWQNRAAVLRAVRHAGVAAGIAAMAMACAPPAEAAGHPVRYAASHAHPSRNETPVSTPHIRGRKKAEPQPAATAKSKHKRGAAKSSEAKSDEAKSGKTRTRGHSKSRRHQDEAPENDPPVIHRAGGRAARKETAKKLAQTPAKKIATPQDFLRAAGGAAPDDSAKKATEAAKEASAPETAPPAVPPLVAASAPAKSAPLAVATSDVAADLAADVAAAKTAFGHGRAKVSPMPEDHATREEIVEQAMTPVVLPNLSYRRGRLMMPPPLKGSHDILVHQNTMADSEGLDRIRDDDDLDRMQALHLLVALHSTGGLLVNEELPENRRYARPWAARFASDTARAFYARFHQPLRLNSAVRTVEYQLRLQRVNGNAAAVDGDGASPHLTGQALDFGKRGMSAAQIAWMRAYLGPLMRAGKLDVEEEFQQACFHVSVYRSYVPAPRAKPKVEVAQVKPEPVAGK